MAVQDIVQDALPNVGEQVQKLKDQIAEPFLTYDFTMNIMITLAIASVTVLLILFLLCRNVKQKVLPSPSTTGPFRRFRKREKILFYGTKIFRKVKTFTKNTIRVDSSGGPGRSRMKKRQIVMKLAKKLLQFKKEKQPQLRVKEPPQSLLEADLTDLQSGSEYRLPPEVMYMLKSIRVFGHFERPLFLELCKHMESTQVLQGQLLFSVGEPDDSIYVVQSGKLNVFVTDYDGKEHIMKEVVEGDSVHSLLSILDVLTGHPAPFKTVSAVASVDSTVLKLPVAAFRMVLEKYPESQVRVVQVIMVRLQRVTFMALHNYLGLSHELINPQNLSDKTFSIHTISPRGSPTKGGIFGNYQGAYSAASYSSERVTKVTNYDEEGTEATPLEMSEPKCKPPKRTPPIAMLGHRNTEEAEIEARRSDFDAACTRARVADVVSSSPPIRSGSDEMMRQGTPNKMRVKKTQFAEESHSAESIKKSLNEDEILKLAMTDIAKLFGLEDEDLLDGLCVLRRISHGTVLTKQGEQDASMVFVVTGTLQVLQQVVGHEDESTSLFIAHPGEVIGSLAVLTGEPSFFTMKARTDARVVTITKQDFYKIMREQPSVVLNVAHTEVRRMSPFVRQIDFALDWMHLEAGRALFRQTEHSDCVYIILSGRLRSVITLQNGKKQLVGEYGRGELVGIVEVLTQTDRATTILAVRDTELAKIPTELLNMIKWKHPQVVTRLIHLLGQRILGNLQESHMPSFTNLLSENPNVDQRPTVANLATVAIIPVSDKVPLYNFTMELQWALNAIGPTLRLTSKKIQERLGAAALDSINEYRLASWLGQQEDIHRMVLYQTDPGMTPWTQRCIRQADCILIVGLGDSAPTDIGDVEKQLENIAVRAQKELVLLHKEETERPRRTVEWLNSRGWVSSHHHIKAPKRMFSKRPHDRMVEVYEKLKVTTISRQSDFSRLARFLTGTSIGLVLGGGGARGISHVGMIRAMNEAGIPIDMVAGTSIGSLIGALWCEERNMIRFTQRAREWCLAMSSLWEKILDLTYPVTSMFSGRAFNRGVETVFKDKQIEDLWIPYRCITTDITASKMRVHTNGSLWRYVRSSMSLSGYLPPLCDPEDGHLLVDGGYVNNLPADILHASGAKTVFAIDVGSQYDPDLYNYGDQLSGWWLLWKRWNPWAENIRVPNMAEIQTRLAYVSGVRQMEMVKNAPYCEYIRPPIDCFQTLQFGSFDEINEVGYNHGKTLFAAWAKSQLMEELFEEKTGQLSIRKMKQQTQQQTVPDVNFTDLAELISRIEEPKSCLPSDIESEEEEEEVIAVQSETSLTLASSGSPRKKPKFRPYSEGDDPNWEDIESDSQPRRRNVPSTIEELSPEER